VPYVNQPEQIIPGRPLFFTTAFQRGGYAYGLLAESQTGRPTKLEGNPQHPASLGSTDAPGQGSLLTLYDPDRSQAVRSMGNYTTWEEFLGHVDASMPAWRANGGAGLRVLLEPVTSPTLASQIPLFLKTFPNARLCQYDPVGRDGARDGARLAFGADVRPIYHFDRAARIVSLDCNFL